MLEKFEQLDRAYVSSFANIVDTDWGYLAYNEHQPDYYDANHAYISTFNQSHHEVIEEVSRFYQEKQLTPRFYLTLNKGYEEFLAALKEDGFQYEEFMSPLQLWETKVAVEVHPAVTIEEVTTEAAKQNAIAIECQIDELGGEIREQAFEAEYAHPAYTHYLLSYNGIPCSTACIFQHHHDARLESVATLKEFRGKGLIGQLITHMQHVVTERGIERFWVAPINEQVEKVYKKSGFNTVAIFKTGHAFLGGKSIKDIQNGQ
ncbi:GNAT family N-acetyltransferase [Metabacillus malikii]|uniref:GNAT superfamily N-acetyltransferase n=1 Tax=Metabacillus malikii TaxID=1504265 RepID=A0ABT9ZBQ2_9BACI|nr:GNAT family N-acetyltransferase [Metabacillus malikii]MDQ0229652.1 GNAT superfamily N-acetyltransferase [Metabacillus malikii]